MARFIPRSTRQPFPVSTSEWIPSEIMAEEPVTAAAKNLMIAMIRLPAMAAKTAILEPLCVAVSYLPVIITRVEHWYIFQL